MTRAVTQSSRTVTVAQESLAQLVIQAMQSADRTASGAAQEAGEGGSSDPAAAQPDALTRVAGAKKLVSGFDGLPGKLAKPHRVAPYG